MDTILTILVLSGTALLWGAYRLWRRGERQKPALMAVCALILWVNAAIWMLPGPVSPAAMTSGGERQ